MTTRGRILSLAAAASLPWAAPAAAPADGAFGYSGYLLTSAGAAETTAQDLRFALYDAATGGTEVWSQTLKVVPDAQGWFSVALGGAGHPLPPGQVANQLWLGIQVGSEPEMAPRTPLGAVPLALGVDWGGVLNRPAACSSGSYLRGFDPATGAAQCEASAGGSAVSSVVGTGAIGASPTTGAVQVSLNGCGAANQMLQWSGTGWSCVATPAGGVAGVGAAAPLQSSGGTSPVLSLPQASAASDGYLAKGDYARLNPGGCAAGQIAAFNGVWTCADPPAFPRSRVNFLTWVSAPAPVGTTGSTVNVGPAFGLAKVDAASDLEIHLDMVAQVSLGLLASPSPITFCLVVSPNLAPASGSCTVVETSGTSAFHIYTRLQSLAAGAHSIQLTLAGASGMTVAVQASPSTSYLFANEVY